MAAPARLSLGEGLRRLRELTDDALPTAAAASADVRSTPPPTVDHALLDRLRNVHNGLNYLHPASAAWVEPLVQHGIVPATAALLQRLLRTHRHSPASFQAGGPPLAAARGDPMAAPRSGVETSALRFALLCVRTAAVLLDHAAEAFAIVAINASQAGGGSAGAAAGRASALKLWEQLAAPATLQALADAARWVEAEVWPAAHAEVAVTAAGGPTQRTRLPLAGQGPVPAPSAAALTELTEHACEVLSTAAAVVKYVARYSDLQLPPAAGAGAAGAAAAAPSVAATAARQRALLAALRDSGVLSAVSAALLAAPPCPDVAPDATALIPAVQEMATAQSAVFCSLQALTDIIRPYDGIEAVTALLAAPDVQRLRWAALEQLAAVAPAAADGHDATSAAFTGAPGGGGGSDARGCWLLLQPHVIRLHPEFEGRLACPCVSLLAAVIAAPVRWLFCPSDANTGGGARPPGDRVDRAERLAAAGRLLPPPRRLAALAAACSRTLCLEVEAGLAAVAAKPGGPGGDGGSSGAAAGDRSSSLVLGDLLFDLAMVSRALSVADEAACATDMLQTDAWVLRARTAAVAAGSLRGAAYDEVRTRDPALDADFLVRSLTLMVQGFNSLDAATRAARVRLLLPARLMQSLDRLLRSLAAAGLRTERARITCGACMLLTYNLLPAMLRADHSWVRNDGSTRGGGGSAWQPQDELGVLVTLAKLARREAEQLGLGGTGRDAASAEALPDLAQKSATLLAGTAVNLSALLNDLPPPPRATRERAQGSGAAVLGRSADATLAAAVRESIALASVTALPILEQKAVRDMCGPGGGSGGGSSSSTGGAQNATDVAGCSISIAGILRCLAAAARLLPPADLLALQPQRTLALLGRLLQRADELRRPSAGRGSRGRGSGVERRENESSEGRQLSQYAEEVVGVLVHMAADEQLVGAVTGWLRAEASASMAEAQPQGWQQQCGDLDARALAASLRALNVDAADCVDGLHGFAAMPGPPSADLAGAGGGGGGSGQLQVIAREIIAGAPRGFSDLLMRGGPPVQAPAWPPRVLRLCVNPACRNFDGPAEADLPLRKCSACEAVRYCGAGCQRQHWREGGHKKECAGLRAMRGAIEAAGGGN
ncbi:hypothetical protein TSOC_005068 [Tetrabaena socialis]|uniref:MYND-type domain-containing protein n=1 Tax=Tetrabaena socialis TaxID=47790 RepID=A0A2J8A742_9CHLO|nr:hypothetical protein TSOC_005068 [Tetrabaena socialis]|eukprot:PNH08337.1 hypothetical protein TSOC_005068 [Tetrabaena socialis]